MKKGVLQLCIVNIYLSLNKFKAYRSLALLPGFIKRYYNFILKMEHDFY